MARRPVTEFAFHDLRSWRAAVRRYYRDRRFSRMKYGISVLAVALAAAVAPAMAADANRSLAGYAHYELHDITAEVKVHPKVMAKLETELKLKLDEPMAKWNAAGEGSGHGGTLAIEVRIDEMKFV